MVAIDTSELPRERRGIRPVTVLLVAFGTLLVLLALAVCGGLYWSGQQIKTELAKIRAAGEPVTPADLEAFYSLSPDSRDATALWMSAADVLMSEEYKADAKDLVVGDYINMMPDPDVPWPEQAAVEQLLLRYAEPLARVHQAVVMGGAARYPTRVADDPGLASTVQLQSQLSALTPLLLLEAKARARRGDAHAACESVRGVLALARSFERAPFHVSLLLRLARDRDAIGCFERLLPMFDLPDDDVAVIDEDLAYIDYCPSFRRGIIGERVVNMQLFGHPDVLGGQSPKFAKWSIVRQGDFAVYLQVMDDLVVASHVKNVSSLRAAVQRAEDRISKVTAAAGARWRYPITKALSNPSWQPFADAVCRGTALRDATRTAIAIERFRHARGGLPEALDDLVPDFIPQVPNDPFRGAPLEFRVTESDYRIYSVGTDGTDQGGIAEGSGAPGDIVFRVPLRRAADK